LYKKIASLPEAEKKAIEDDIMATYGKRSKMAMVDGGKGITNLHVPSDIIIDNSMPTALRDGGKMWNTADKQEDFLATIPDRGYGLCFDEVVKFCQKNGAFDPKTMGGCPNVGLMAQKAEEYGSHPNTFEVQKAGTVRIVVKSSGKILLGHKLAKGDIYRACQTKDEPIKDWVKLAVARARANDFPAPSNEKPCKAIFWLDSARAHDVILMGLVQKYLPAFDTKGLDLEIMSPNEAMRATLQRAKEGLNTITVTGNVLRDYNTDLFPILELNTSAKMLSIVPMLNGGAMYETGAGGSAPKHVQQLQKENHLRWDSLGEYLALTCAFQDLALKNPKAKVLAGALNRAVGTFLIANKNPGRKVKEIDNRGAHYWVARYWSEELAKQSEDQALKTVFATTAKELADEEEKVLKDFVDCQGPAVDIGGYYRVDKEKADKIMQPSTTFNGIVDRLAKCVS
jgi:isocitrate dehydrogenase